MRISDWSSDVCSSDLRFVEDQQVRRVAGDQREREPRTLAARQLADLGDRLVAGEAEASQLRAHRARRLARHHARHMAERCVGAVEFLDLILGEIADAHLARCRSEEHTSELQSLMRISYAVFCL